MKNGSVKVGDLIVSKYFKGIFKVIAIEERYWKYGLEVGQRYGDLVSFEYISDGEGNLTKKRKTGSVDISHITLAKDFIKQTIEKEQRKINRLNYILEFYGK